MQYLPLKRKPKVEERKRHPVLCIVAMMESNGSQWQWHFSTPAHSKMLIISDSDSEAQHSTESSEPEPRARAALAEALGNKRIRTSKGHPWRVAESAAMAVVPMP